MLLSDQQVETFWREGYHFPVPVLDAGEVAGYRGQLEAVEAPRGGRLGSGERNKSHLLFKWLDDLIRDPRILDPIEQLIGPDILCWNTIFWIKEAGAPSFVSWHQDNRYWGLSSDKVISAWLALSEASIEAGCMRVMPGSHRGDVLAHADVYDADNMLTRGQEITEGIDERAAVLMPLKAGEMSLHSYRLAHASGPNASADRRIGISMHFMPPETSQTVGSWDSAALVRGRDPYGNFEHTPVPAGDFDAEAVTFHERASKAVSDVLYHGAAVNTAKL